MDSDSEHVEGEEGVNSDGVQGRSCGVERESMRDASPMAVIVGVLGEKKDLTGCDGVAKTHSGSREMINGSTGVVKDVVMTTPPKRGTGKGS